MKENNKEFSVAEKLEYFRKLVKEQEQKCLVLDAKQILATNRLEFLQKQVKRLEEESNS